MSTLVELLRVHGHEVVVRTGEHVLLSFGATLLSTLIGVPLGVWASRRPRVERPLLGFVDAVQTIPSLALFGLLLPLPLIGGIGATPAMVALVLYALLPIVRTTVVGVRVAAVTSIGTATIAAAIGAGGLGTFVFQGVAMVDDGVILLGAVPAALLALIVDAIVRLLERRMARGME
ncbi:MAG: ABC transporter permease [Polyangiales bacterium]